MDWINEILEKGNIKAQNKKKGLFLVWYKDTAFVIHDNRVVATSVFVATAKRTYDRIRKAQ